jgi:hypothetical protein
MIAPHTELIAEYWHAFACAVLVTRSTTSPEREKSRCAAPPLPARTRQSSFTTARQKSCIPIRLQEHPHDDLYPPP